MKETSSDFLGKSRIALRIIFDLLVGVPINGYTRVLFKKELFEIDFLIDCSTPIIAYVACWLCAILAFISVFIGVFNLGFGLFLLSVASFYWLAYYLQLGED